METAGPVPVLCAGWFFWLPETALTNEERAVHEFELTLTPYKRDPPEVRAAKLAAATCIPCCYAFAKQPGLWGAPRAYAAAQGWGMAPEYALLDTSSTGSALPAGAAFTGALADTPAFPQVPALAAVLAYWARAPCGAALALLVMPCGTGKTRTMIAAAIAAGRRTAILILTRLDLLEQALEEAEHETRGVRLGVVQGTTWDVGDEYDVVVMMAHTLDVAVRTHGAAATRSRLRAHTFGTLLLDEAHTALSERGVRVLSLFTPRFALSVTATPDRDDGLVEELRALLGPVVYTAVEVPGRLDYVAVRYAVYPPRAPRVHRDGTMDNAALWNGIADDTVLNALLAHLASAALDDGRTVLLVTLRAEGQIPELTRRIAAARVGRGDWRRSVPRHCVMPRKRGGRAVMAASSTDEEQAPLIACTFGGMPAALAAELCACMPAQGVLAYNSAGRTPATRHAAFLAKRARVLIVFIDRVSQGFNMPWADTLIYGGARKGHNISVQSANRVTREFPGKRPPLVLDVACNFAAYGGLLRAQVARCGYMRACGCAVASLDFDGAQAPTAFTWDHIEAAVTTARAALGRGPTCMDPCGGAAECDSAGEDTGS